MSVRDLYQAVSTGLSGVTLKFGGNSLEEHDSAPKVTFVPAEFTFVSAKQKPGLGRAWQERGAWLKRQRVDVHCWGQDLHDPSIAAQFAATEALVDRVIWVIHRVAAGAYELGASTPLPDGISDAGVVMVLTVFFFIPVVEAEAARQLTTAPILDVSSGLNVPVTGTLPAVTGESDFNGTIISGTPAP